MQATPRHRLRRAFSWVLDHPWHIVLVVVVLGVVKWAVDSRSEPYIVKASFNSAFNLVPGLPVDIHGNQVGKITGVKYDGSVAGGQAIVSLGIDNPSFIPLHRGTTVEARWGSTIGNGTRRLDVTPGSTHAPKIADQGIIETKDTVPAQDVDQELDIFTTATRHRLTSLLGELQPGFQDQAPAMHRALNAAPPALSAANGVFSDLDTDSYALSHLITSADSVTGTLAARAASVSHLVSVAGTTFSTLAQHASQLQQTISSLPAALREARGTLARLDTSVHVVRGLIDDIRPGAAQLAPLATQLGPTLGALRSVVPNGVATLRTATAAAPSITRLLQVGTPFAPKVTSAASQLAPMLACIRPYTPEAGTAVIDASEWIQDYVLQQPNQGLVQYIGKRDGQFVQQHGVRAMPEVSTESFHAYPINSKLFTQLTGKQYDYIRPPGFTVQQPWFQPQCGDTPAGLNAADDPEAAK